VIGIKEREGARIRAARGACALDQFDQIILFSRFVGATNLA
jgi:hypothetical protein